MTSDGLKAAMRLACAALLSGAVVLSGPALSIAAEQPSAGQIVDALKSSAPPPSAPLTRGFRVAPAVPLNALSADEARAIDRVRSKATRAITIEERTDLANIAAKKPGIDLEINFDYNSAAIGPKAAQTLAVLGEALQHPALKGATILVAGHTDAAGSNGYNKDLSDRRADAVRAFLITVVKLSPEAIVAVGYGEERLKNTSDPYAGENRRVQIVNMSGAK